MIEYQDLLKTAEELKKEQLESQVKGHLEQLDKNKWRMLNETRELIYELEVRLKNIDDALSTHSNLTEINIRALLSGKKEIKEILSWINS